MGQFALLVGISEYEPGLTELPSAARDITAMQRVLQHSENGYFAESDITVLVNKDKQQIEQEIYTLFDDRKKDDLLLFYFSGHGITDDYGELLSLNSLYSEK